MCAHFFRICVVGLLPAEGVLKAASRWLDLLRVGTSIGGAWGILRNGSKFADLSATQYAIALDWLKSLGVVDLFIDAKGVGAPIGATLLTTAIGRLEPPWLADAEWLFPSPDDLTVDVLRLAELFGVAERSLAPLIRGLGRKFDRERISAIGLAGEQELAALVEETFPGATRHVSLVDDSLGYDLVVSGDREVHVEVKSTIRRGRLVIHLSRHELEVGEADDRWTLAVVGLDSELQLCAVATVPLSVLISRRPRDVSYLGRWDSVAIELGREDLETGLRLGWATLSPHREPRAGSANFGWMPGPAPRSAEL